MLLIYLRKMGRKYVIALLGIEVTYHQQTIFQGILNNLGLMIDFNFS